LQARARREHDWLARNASGGWAATAAAPEEARPLLELYAPLCAASSDKPITIAHLGQSLDGCIATSSGDSYYVTGPDNVVHLHRLRALCDAVVVGAGTVERDDPQLTVRHVEGENPARVILDPNGRIRADRRVLQADAETFLVRAPDTPRAAQPPRGAVLSARRQDDGRFDLRALLDELHARGFFAVFVEGGGSTVSSFLEAELVDRLHIAIAPLVTGRGCPGLTLPARDKIADCLRPAHRVFTMGGDVLFDCDLRSPARAPSAPSGHLHRVI